MRHLSLSIAALQVLILTKFILQLSVTLPCSQKVTKFQLLLRAIIDMIAMA